MTPRPSLCSLRHLHGLRTPYLASLWILELALAWRVLPAIARELQALLPIGSASEPLTRAIEVVLTACVVAALAACLALPAIAAMLHGRVGPRGDEREGPSRARIPECAARPYSGDPRAGPRWEAGSMCCASAGVALAGAALFVVGAVIELAVGRVAWPALPPGVPGPAIVAIGILLLIAGGLVTEILCRTHGDCVDGEAPGTSRQHRGRRLAVSATTAG